MDDTWYTVQEVALLLGVGGEAVSEYCREGVLPGAYKQGTRWRIPESSVREWMEGCKVYLVRRPGATGWAGDGQIRAGVVCARNPTHARVMMAANCGVEGVAAWSDARVVPVNTQQDARVVLRSGGGA